MQYFLMALTLIFVLAKLFGQIDWSWWLVFLPMLPAFVMWIIAAIFVWVVKSALSGQKLTSRHRRIR